MSRQYSGFCTITTMGFSHGAGKRMNVRWEILSCVGIKWTLSNILAPFNYVCLPLYCGCCSTEMNSNNFFFFGRYYPYHYAPYLSDIRNISKLKIQFELGKPFMPFEQLLAVLPAASKDLLPKCYQVGFIILSLPVLSYTYYFLNKKLSSAIFSVPVVKLSLTFRL